MTRIGDLFRAGLKAAPDEVIHPTGGSVIHFPNVDPRWRTKIGDGSASSIVNACLKVITRAFPAAPPTITLETVDGPQPAPDHPAAKILRTPNPHLSGVLVFNSWITALHTTGNAYGWIIRNAVGQPVEVWPIHPGHMQPVGTARKFLSHYRYTPGTDAVDIPPEDVLHLRLDLDSRDFRVGESPLTPVLREVLTDEEASEYTSALLLNMGIPGVVISPADERQPPPNPDQAREIRSKFEERFTGRNRGSAMVLTERIKLDTVGLNPGELLLDKVREIPETRIAGALGVPPILAYLAAGLSMSSGRNETKELRAEFTESKLVPLWSLIGDQIQAQLVDQIDPAATFAFDTSKVSALAEDAEVVAARDRADLSAGGITLAEFRRRRGLDVGTEHDVYYVPTSTIVAPVGDIVDSDPVE